MITFVNCSFEYHKKEKIIDEFSYQFADNGIYALVGKSGSGKTTILNLISGLLKPNEGKILYSNDFTNISESISYIFQNDNLFGNLTVLENINILVKITSKKINNDEIDEVLRRLGIIQYKYNKVSEISGGERQRVAIAIALLKKSKVILADEPCASLDYETSKEIMNIFKDISNDKLIIISSHNLELVNEYCSNIIDFPCDCDRKIENNFDNCFEPKYVGKNISIFNIIKTYTKVFGHKIYLGLLSFVMFTIVISLSIFSLSVAKIDEEKIMTNKIINDDISDVFVFGDTSSLPNSLKHSGLKWVNDNWNIYNFNGKNKDSNYRLLFVCFKIL